MGASGWFGRVDYQSDIRAALEVARWDAFRAGHFYRSSNELPEALTMTEDEFVDWCEEEFGEIVSLAEARFTWRAVRTKPENPDMLAASQPDSGTHSVIDMRGVADTPEYFKVAPAPITVLDALFSTPTPSTDAVAAAAADGKLDLYGRWHGTYVVGYRDDVPETIFFVGSSGD